MKLKKLFILGVICYYVPYASATYRVDPWNGQRSDLAVQQKGYAFYFCDLRGNECFAVYLNDQDYRNLLRKLSVYRGKTVEDTIDIIRRDSDIAASLLRYFKEFRNINSMQEVLTILERRTE